MNIQTIRTFVRTHRMASFGVVLALCIVGYWFLHGSRASADTRYVLGTVTRGTLTVSVSGFGQIEASDQIDVKPKTSGDITSVLVTSGQKVFTGQVLAYLNAQDEQQAVRNAQIALQNAQITLKKLQQNQTIDAETAAEDLDQEYADALNTVSNAFLKLPDLVDTARGILYDDTINGGCSPNTCEYGNLIGDTSEHVFTAATARAESDYQTARTAYDATFADYRALRLDAPSDQITTIVSATEQTATLLAQTIKSEQNMLDLLVNDMKDQATKNSVPARIPAQITTYQNSIAGAISALNTVDSQLSSSVHAIQSAQRALDNSTLSNPLDLASQQNTVTQRENDLHNANIALSNCVVRSPIAGVVAKVNVKRGDSASSGTAIATVLSTKQLAVVPLNEVDIAAVQLGQKATITFDAVEGLTMTGTVVEVDSLGTTTQGVVTYNVTIALDTQDARIRSGMSMTTNIVTKAVQDALLVPSSALKTINGSFYVQALDGVTDVQAADISGIVSKTAPRNISVEIGVSNDSSVQITSGVNEGDQIIARTISGSAAPATTSTSRNSMQSGGGFMMR